MVPGKKRLPRKRRVEYCVREEVIVSVSRVGKNGPEPGVIRMEMRKGAAFYVDESKVREARPKADILYGE